MPVKVNADVAGLTGRIRQVGKKAASHGADTLRAQGQKVAQRAKDYAPIDDGYLRDAIQVAEYRGDNNRIEVVVYVDEEAPAANGTVGQYATLMHEGITPYGSGEYGQARTAGTGAKFMERAFDDLEPDITDAIERAIRGLL